MVTRPTATTTLTLDAKSAERAAWRALADKERRLTIEREKLESSKRGPLTKQLGETREQMDVLAADIATGQITLTLTGLSNGQYRNLLKNHGPREGEDLDQRVGYNADTFGRALLDATTLKAEDHAGQGVPLDIEEWTDEDDGVGPADFETWFKTALALQTRPVDQSPPLRAS